MFWSLYYLVLRRMLHLAALPFRSEEFKSSRSSYSHKIAVLRPQAARLQLRPADRVFLAASRLLPANELGGPLFVTPTTLLRWHRRPRDPTL